MKPKTENPPKLKLPKEIKRKVEKEYPVKWAFDALTRKVVKLTNEEEENKYEKNVVFKDYLTALRHKEAFLEKGIETTKRIIKRYQKILTMFNGELLLAKEELRNIL